jgi:hypothetical protein
MEDVDLEFNIQLERQSVIEENPHLPETDSKGKTKKGETSTSAGSPSKSTDE